jgi:hypothetical protein
MLTPHFVIKAPQAILYSMAASRMLFADIHLNVGRSDSQPSRHHPLR